jgi:hypothetical protein
LFSARAGDWQGLIGALLADLAAQPAVDGVRPQARDANGAISAATAQAATVKARCGSRRAAADMLVGGPPVPPSPETEAQVQALFRTVPLTSDEKIAMSKVIDDISSLAPRRRLKITPKLVGRQILSQKAAAGCGPSGWRNSHLSAVYLDAAGPQALAEWAGVWASGKISPWLAALWTATLARPFFKTEQCDSVHPILQSEALLKFAFGCCAKGCRVELERGAGERQYGAGRPGGAALEIAEIRAAAAMRPDCALIALDEQNAFGALECGTPRPLPYRYRCYGGTARASSSTF